MSEKITQTAGRAQLGEFAPMFAHLNDDVLFGEVWNAEALEEEIAAIITHATMYVGWPKGWAVFRQAKEIWNE